MSDQYEIDREDIAVRYDCGPDEPDLAPYVGFPEMERQKDSLLHALLESTYHTYMTIHLVDYLHPRSPLLPRRPYEWRFK